METRLAGPEDAAALAGLHAGSFGAARWTPEQVKGSLAQKTTLTVVAQEGGAARGFIMCQIVEGEAEVLTLCVDAAFRRAGAGLKLVEAALAEMQKREAHRVFLEVAADNAAALGLYEKAGFRAIGKRAKYYSREGGEAADAVRMALYL